MSNEKYVFFDIDGTIYDYVNGVSPSAKEAVRLLRENGHHPVLCTGRTRIMIFDEIMDMGFDGIIAGGGTYIEWDGKLLKAEELPRKEVIRLVKTLSENGFSTYPEGINELYYDRNYVENGEDAIYVIYKKHIPDHIKPIDLESEMHVSKVSATYTAKSNRDAVLAELGDDYDWADHNGVMLETIPKNASKGTGVRQLIEYLGADMEDTYAFGDSFNDLDMLQTVKYGVAMGNSKESLKKLVPIHTEALLDGGVYKALKRFGLI